MKVYLSKVAEIRLDSILEYIEAEWGKSVSEAFLQKVEIEFEQISKYPFKCPNTQTFSDLYVCVLSKQTSAIYRVLVEENEVEIITIFDTRQDPDKLHSEIKKFFEHNR
jgi:plasmid stabilization system protein ParE